MLSVIEKCLRCRQFRYLSEDVAELIKAQVLDTDAITS